MLYGFIYSQEFNSLASAYGVNVEVRELPGEPLDDNEYPQANDG